MLLKRLLAHAGYMEGEPGATGGVAAAAPAAAAPAADAGTFAASAAPAAAAADGAAASADPLSSDSLAAATGADGKPAEGDGDKSADGDNKDAKPDGDKPIEYTDFKLPEGVKVDDEVMGQFKTLAAEAKVSQETAQKFMDLHSAAIAKAAAAPFDAWRSTQSAWQAEIKADPDIGGKNLNQSQATIAKLIDSLGKNEAQAFRQALNFTGAGNNPAIVKALVKIGQTFTEGGPVNGGGKPAEVKSPAKSIYPTLN